MPERAADTLRVFELPQPFLKIEEVDTRRLEAAPERGNASLVMEAAASPPPRRSVAPRPGALAATKINPAAELLTAAAPLAISSPAPAGQERGGTGVGGTGMSGDGGVHGGEGGAGIAVGARQLGGKLFNADYPRTARDSGAEGTVLVRFAVDPRGRATGCVVTRSSGHAALDETTCRLIERRFRYEPARDADGRPVADVIVGRQTWWLARREPTLARAAPVAGPAPADPEQPEPPPLER